MESELLPIREDVTAVPLQQQETREVFMQESAEGLAGVDLKTLTAGSIIEVETKSRHYRIEYMEGDRIRISGHPQWCPSPTLARLCGSRRGLNEFTQGYIGCGMRLVFERVGDAIPVTTSEITDIRVTDRNFVTGRE